MTPAQAINVIDQVVEQTSFKPADYRHVQAAMAVLRSLANPTPPPADPNAPPLQPPRPGDAARQAAMDAAATTPPAQPE